MIKNLLSICACLALFQSNAQLDSASFSVQDGGPSFDRYISVPTPVGSNLRMTGSWTIEAWVFVPSSSDLSQMFVVETYSATNTGGFILRVTPPNVHAYQFNGPSSYNQVFGNGQLNLGAWNHIAAAMDVDQDTLFVFLNGTLDGQGYAPLNTVNTNDYMFIGARGDDQNVNQPIQIDEVRIWNYARTESEISADMNSCLSGSETGLLAYYDFENLSSSVVTDKTSNNNDGGVINYVAVDTYVDGVFVCEVSSANMNDQDQTNFVIYPNPATDYLQIQSDEIIHHVKIYNPSGMLLVDEKENTLIDISDLMSGPYIIQIETENEMVTKRLIKQ